MSTQLPSSLSDTQRAMIATACSTLRWQAHDSFMLELSSALARLPLPISDTDLRACIRQILGVPVDQF
jgi:hypothetical protein